MTALVLPQLPLTFGNSIVATADAERSYFGARADRVRPARLAASIGIANGLAGLSGAMPVCHGAGGVTAHFRLGARTPFATLGTGVLFLFVSLIAPAVLFAPLGAAMVTAAPIEIDAAARLENLLQLTSTSLDPALHTRQRYAGPLGEDECFAQRSVERVDDRVDRQLHRRR